MQIVESTIKHKDYFIIQLTSLIINEILDFDLYLESGTKVVLYRSSELPFTEENRLSLLENKIKTLLIHVNNRKKFQVYLEKNINTILRDELITDHSKATIIYDAVKLVVSDVFSSPTNPSNIKRSQTLVESIIFFIFQGRNPLFDLLNVMSFDYSTFTHSVNVSTLSITFANYLGIKESDKLIILGTGALLHDIGKTKIPEAILNKRGSLTDDEMNLIKKHPQWGYDLMKKADILPEESLIPILQHHEREDGSGYPNNLQSDEIHLYGKIVGIADVFDAMTTEKIYRPAIETFPALKEMFEKESGLDSKLVEDFIKMLGQKPVYTE